MNLQLKSEELTFLLYYLLRRRALKTNHGNIHCVGRVRSGALACCTTSHSASAKSAALTDKPRHFKIENSDTCGAYEKLSLQR